MFPVNSHDTELAAWKDGDFAAFDTPLPVIDNGRGRQRLGGVQHPPIVELRSFAG
jgi:hypothetical protein